MRGWTAALFTLLALMLIAPSPARAFEVCDSEFGDESKIPGALIAGIRFSTPYRDDALTWKVGIELSDDSESFGPQIMPAAEAGHFVIEIPRGFAHLNCRLVMTIALTGDMTGIARDMDECLPKTGMGGFSQCLDRALRQRAALADRQLVALSPLQRDRMESRPLASLHFLILHEFAHAALGHFALADDSEVDSRDLEFAADLYASRYLTIWGGNSSGGVMHFSALAMIKYPGFNAGPTHDPPSCRFEDASNIAATLEEIPGLLLIMPVRTSLSEFADPATLTARRAALRLIATDSRASQAPVRFSQACRIKSLPQLAAMRRDLVQLARFQDRVADKLPGPNDGVAVARIIEDLVALRLESADGTAVRLHLIAAYLLSYGDTRASLAVTALIPAILNRPDLVDDALLQDVGILNQEFGKRIFYFPPQGKPFSYEILRAYLERGFYFGPYDSETFVALIRLELRKGDCGEARRWLRVASPSRSPRMFAPALATTIEREVAAACPGA